MLPLNYAILKYIDSVPEADADSIIENLKGQYNGFGAFKKKAIVEALMTAEKNEILEESHYDLDSNGDVRVFYKVSPSGAQLIETFI